MGLSPGLLQSLFDLRCSALEVNFPDTERHKRAAMAAGLLPYSPVKTGYLCRSLQ
jgi:hypothetical protein